MKEGNLKVLKNTIKELEKYKKVLLLTCSNRGEEVSKTQLPKSSILARVIHNNLDNSTIIDVTKLKIYPCEGNVSRMEGNVCGIKEALLDDPEKNPSGYHRCWASVHNPDDELWKISKELFESDAVVFLSSVRWGQTNMFYQNLIERLTWIENRHTALGESNLVEDIETGFICTGQNFNGVNVNDLQKKIHEFYGFKINDDLYWNWQYTKDVNDESLKSYKNSHIKFIKDTKIPDTQ